MPPDFFTTTSHGSPANGLNKNITTRDLLLVMRVLHLIDAAGPQATPTTLALLGTSLERLGSTEQKCLLLGGLVLEQAADCAGIRGAIYRNVPAGQALLGRAVLADVIARERPFDLIHCWSIGALSAAVLWLRSAPRLLTLTTAPGTRAVHWLRVLAMHGPGQTAYLPISNTIQRILLSGGVPKAAVHVLRPGLDLSRIAFDERQALRECWGIDREEIRVVALLSDPATHADTIQGMMAVVLAAKSRKQGALSIRLLLHPNQRHRQRGLAISESIQPVDHHPIESRLTCPWQVLPGCDLALALGPDAGGLSLLWAMAANVPIVAEATYAISEILEDRHSALLATPNRPPNLADRMCRIFDDANLAWKLRDTARHEAFSFFSRHRYCRSLKTVYEQAYEHRPIEVPPLEITGGLRFSGRG